MKKIILFALFIATNNISNAQASLYAENTIDNVVVKDALTNEITSYTLMRDHVDKNQWYYEPKRLRLAEKIVAGKKPEPKFSIVKYQYYDKVSNSNKDGGMIFATFTFSARPTEEAQLKEKLLQTTHNPAARLGCMRYKSSTFSILPLASEFVIDTSTFATKKGAISNSDVTVSFPLTGLGVTVISKSGFAIKNDLIFTGMLPPCDLKINGKWDNIYKYEESQTQMGGGFKLLGIGFGAAHKSSTIKEDIKQSNALTIIDANCDDKVSDTRFASVISTIRDAVFTHEANGQVERIKALQKMLDDSTLSNAVRDKIIKAITTSEMSFSYSKTKLSTNQRKRGDLKFEYTKYTTADRETSLSGLMKLQDYFTSEEDLKKYILEVNYQGFPEVVFGLPPDFDQSLKIRSATIKIKIPQDLRSLDPNLANVKDRSATWTPEKGWLMEGNKISSLPFALLGVNKDVVERLNFQTELSIASESANNNISIVSNIKAFNGIDNFGALEQLVNTIRVDASNIDFKKLTQGGSDIDMITVKFKQGNKTYSRDIKPMQINGSIQLPDIATFLIPKNTDGENSTEIEVLFYRADQQQPVKWQNNGPFDGSELTLRNLDWRN